MSLLDKMKLGARNVVNKAKEEVKSELKYRAAAKKNIKRKSKAAFWKEKEKMAVAKAKAKARTGSFGGFDVNQSPFEPKKKQKEMKWF